MGRSVLVSTAAVFAVSLACVAGADGNAAIAQAQATPAPQTSLPAERSFNQQALEDGARIIVARFDLGRTSSNPDGRPISQWTAQDFFKFSNSEINLIRAMFSDERYDLIDQIKPSSMNREQFSRATLREAARRGTLENPYMRRFSDLPTNEVSVMRPLGVSPEAQRQVTATPITLTFYDNAAIIIINPRIARIEIEPDVARAIGRPDFAGSGVSIANDAATYDLGYTVGALPQFRRGQILGLALGFAQPAEVLEAAFCPISSEIFRLEGRTLDQTEAFAAGFAQARIDARSNFQGTNIPVGLSSPCPSISARVTLQDRLNFRPTPLAQ